MRGGRPPAWLQTSPAPNSAATTASPGSSALPRVVEQVGACLARRAPHLGAPGVDADDQRRVPRGAPPRRTPPYAGSPRRASTGSPGPAFTPPTSTIAAPCSTATVDRRHRRRVVEVGALVEERVRRPVDDGHHRAGRPRRTRGCRAAASSRVLLSIGWKRGRREHGTILSCRSSCCSPRSPSWRPSPSSPPDAGGSLGTSTPRPLPAGRVAGRRRRPRGDRRAAVLPRVPGLSHGRGRRGAGPAGGELEIAGPPHRRAGGRQTAASGLPDRTRERPRAAADASGEAWSGVAELVVTQDVDAPAERVWSALVDWDLHDEWMLLTRASGGAAVGESHRGLHRRRAARLPRPDDDRRLGAAAARGGAAHRTRGPRQRRVRGAGALGGRSSVVWSEWIDLPLGVARPARAGRSYAR